MNGPARTPKGLVDRLAALPHFDPQVTLRNVGGGEDRLERVLRTFVRRYELGEPALLDAASPDALAQWRAAAHSMRGACATIGASLLPRGLDEFERRLARGDDAASLAPSARDLHAQLLAAVNALTAALDPPEATS